MTFQVWAVLQQTSSGEQKAVLQNEMEQLHIAKGHLEEQCKAAEAGQLDAQVLHRHC